MVVVSSFVAAGKAYALIGAVFAGWFAIRGADRLEPGAVGSTTGFRLLLLPGALVLWPYLATRLWQARQ